jgi:hypothetical protein
MVKRHNQEYETISPPDESNVSERLDVALSCRAEGQHVSEQPRKNALASGRCSMMTKLIDAFFGCRHSRYSFPVTIRGSARRPQAGALTGTYVACLDCGREFPYDWQEMKVITSTAERREYVASLTTRQAA